jgi:D-alanine transaminase
VWELADRLKIPHSADRVPESRLRSAEEIWLSFATRGVLAVTSLDGRPVGSGRPGPMFKRMNAAFAAYLDELSSTPAL